MRPEALIEFHGIVVPIADPCHATAFNEIEVEVTRRADGFTAVAYVFCVSISMREFHTSRRGD